MLISPHPPKSKASGGILGYFKSNLGSFLILKTSTMTHKFDFPIHSLKNTNVLGVLWGHRMFLLILFLHWVMFCQTSLNNTLLVYRINVNTTSGWWRDLTEMMWWMGLESSRQWRLISWVSKPTGPAEVHRFLLAVRHIFSKSFALWSWVRVLYNTDNVSSNTVSSVFNEESHFLTYSNQTDQNRACSYSKRKTKSCWRFKTLFIEGQRVVRRFTIIINVEDRVCTWVSTRKLTVSTRNSFHQQDSFEN